MRAISQRELRKDAAAELDDLLVRRGRRAMDFADFEPITSEESTEDVLRALRGDR